MCVDAIFFDLDGTLIDSAPDIQNLANKGLKGVGADPITLDETHSFIGEGIHVFVQKMRAALAGADAVTVPFKVIRQMEKHPLTESGIAKFLQDAQAKS